mgnify:CR=1 FL=1
MKGEPYLLTDNSRTNMLTFIRMYSPDIHRALIKTDFPPSAFNLVWLYYIKARCLCSILSISELDYIVKKTKRESWEFRCTHCKCLSLLYSISKYRKVNLDELRSLIRYDSKELTRVVEVKEPFRFSDDAKGISIIRI